MVIILFIEHLLYSRHLKYITYPQRTVMQSTGTYYFSAYYNQSIVYFVHIVHCNCVICSVSLSKSRFQIHLNLILHPQCFYYSISPSLILLHQ